MKNVMPGPSHGKFSLIKLNFIKMQYGQLYQINNNFYFRVVVLNVLLLLLSSCHLFL